MADECSCVPPRCSGNLLRRPSIDKEAFYHTVRLRIRHQLLARSLPLFQGKLFVRYLCFVTD